MSVVQDALNWLATQQQTMTQLLIRWSNINSHSYNFNGLKQFHDELVREFKRLQCPISSTPLPALNDISEQGEVVSARMGNLLSIDNLKQGSPNVLLCGHMDTVYPSDSSFNTVKYLDDNTLNGPGVTDMKGGLVVMLFALQAFMQSDLRDKLGWKVLITPDEEIGSQCSAPFLEQSARQADFGLVFEPAMSPEGMLAGKRKGSGKFTLVVRGKAAHAGRAFHQGANAITAMAKIIQAIDQLNSTNPNSVTFNLGRISGGGSVNVVPDFCIAHLDVRTLVPDDQQIIEAQLQKIILDANEWPGISAHLHGTFTRPPKPLVGKTLKLFEQVAKTGHALHQKIEWQDSGGCCDGNNLAQHGLPVVDSLGVRGGRIHSHDEFILLDSLVERSQLTAMLLFEHALGKLNI